MNRTINRQATLAKLRARRQAVKFESEEDEGAMEHCAEIQSVIEAIESGGNDQVIREAAAWVGLDSDLVFQ